MKIEIDKPVIPEYVADWIESRDYYNVYKVLQDLSVTGSPHASKDVRNWIFHNQENVEKFVRAWLDGYEVEEEPMYYAKIKGWEHIGTSSYYFGYDEDNDSLEVTYLESNYHFAFSLTHEHWNKLGINSTNANFEEVE